MQSTPFLTPSFYHWHPRIEAPWAVLSQLQGLQHGDLTLTKHRTPSYKVPFERSNLYMTE